MATIWCQNHLESSLFFGTAKEGVCVFFGVMNLEYPKCKTTRVALPFAHLSNFQNLYDIP